MRRLYWLPLLVVGVAQAGAGQSEHAGHIGHGVKSPQDTNHDAASHEGMDHTGIGHAKHDKASPTVPPAGRGQNTGNINHAGHQDHASMPSMQGGSAPDGARDPNAYADGYGFGEFAHPHMGDDELLGTLLVDRLENITVADDNFVNYDWQAWFGKTYDRVVVRAEGEIEQGAFQNARNELLWGHAITPYWDSHLGFRYDAGRGADRSWLALGVQGLAPYWLYVEATAYLGEEGRSAFRLESEYDILLTQTWVLQPRMEANFYGRRDDNRLVSGGLSDLEAGLRLRYEFKREFAPYIGIEWAGKFGSAADLVKASGSQSEQLRFVAGVRFWF